MELLKIAIRLLNELKIQSDNRVEPIEHVWYSIKEIAKSLGIKRELVRNVLDKMVEFEILEIGSNEPTSYQFTERGKRIGRTELKELF